MFGRIFYATRKFYSVASISKTKIMNSEKCYFRYLQNEEKVDITFLFKVKESFRQFNLSRKPTETLETLFVRIGANVQKVLKKTNKKKAPDNNLEINVNLYNSEDVTINGQSSCLDLFSAKGPVQIKIYDQIYDTVFNAPWVISIDLPHCILVGFPVYPEHFLMQYADTNSSCFNWYRGLDVNEKGNIISEAHIKWELVGKEYVYIPKPQDIGMKIKIECIPGNNERTGPVVEATSKNNVEAGPGKCPFETRHMFTSTKLKNKNFRCVTYNILADLYCDSDFTRTALHPYCPPYALHIDYRKLLLFKELQGYNADLICLQEVDTKIFNHHLEPLLKNEGLSGIFFKKGKEVAEGLTIFYRKERFEVLGNEKIVLSEAIKDKTCLQAIWDGIKDNEALLKRLLDRSTVASATFLQSKENLNDIFIVGNTHLYFHPDADHIRLIQGGAFIYWLNDLCKTMKGKFPGKRISLILCGDFNSVPSCGIYQLYTTGLSPSTLPDWKSNEEEAVSDLGLQQDTLLESACGTPPFTNFTAGFADCLDYIFYDKSTLCVEQVVPLPSIEELQANTALPSVVFPSDHIALVSDLKLL